MDAGVEGPGASASGGMDRGLRGVLRLVRLVTVAFVLMGAGRADPGLVGRAASAAGGGAGLLPVVENRGGYGRVTLPAPVRGAYGLRRDGERIVVIRPGRMVIGSLSQLPRNIVDMASGADSTVFTVRAGARVSIDRVRGRLVLTVYDPPGSETLRQPAAPEQTRNVPGPPAPPGPAEAQQPASRPPVAAAEQVAGVAAASPAAPDAVEFRASPDSEAGGLLLPGTAGAGAAAFRSGDEVVVILDQPLDLKPRTSDPTFERWTSQRTGDATVVRVAARNVGAVHVRLSAQGWVIGAGVAKVAVDDIIPLPVDRPGASYTQLAASRPGRVVSLDDPQSGGLVLVGTQGAPGQAVLEARDYSQYRLLQTLQGVVVSPTSRDVGLRREGPGFLLTAGAAAAQPAAAVTAAPTRARLFSLPREPVSSLLDRLQEQFRAVADAPALARSEPRLQVAETLLALGLGVEAQSVLDVAASADPVLLNAPRAMGLHAAAAILANRLEAGSAVTDPRLAATADGRLWRAVLAIAKDQASADEARVLETELPVLLSYPGPLKDRLLPRVLEAMAINGQAARAGEVLAVLPPAPELELALGMVFEASGRSPDALRRYDAIAGGNDRQAAYRAAVRAAELRIKEGALDNRTGADALDRALSGWREAAQEVPLRIRIASLRRRSGQWQDALGVLRDGIVVFPEQRARLDAELAKTLLALFTGKAADALSPAEMVSFFDRNIETIQAMQWPEPAGLRLVDRLTGLGLPARAEPVLARLLAQAADADRRVFLGARLADLRLELNDGDGAIAALAGSVPAAGAAVDPDTVRDRQMLYARAEAARGNADAAVAMLRTIGTAEADGARADILVGQKRWKDAVSALTDLEQKRVPQSGAMTPEQQAIVMRLAVAAALDEDGATLRRLADRYGAAMATAQAADRFRLLISTPVRATTDLPRAFEEIRLARKVTSQTGSTMPP